MMCFCVLGGNVEMAHWLYTRKTTRRNIILSMPILRLSPQSHCSRLLQVLQTFACESLDEIGKSYLRADFRIECDTPKHKAYKIYAWVMVCICELLYFVQFSDILTDWSYRIPILRQAVLNYLINGIPVPSWHFYPIQNVVYSTVSQVDSTVSSSRSSQTCSLFRRKLLMHWIVGPR